jgi:hypothetical protein
VDRQGSILVAGKTLSAGWISGGSDTTFNDVGEIDRSDLSRRSVWRR